MKDTSLTIDNKDLMNLLRHAFLFGVNAGSDFDVLERDSDLGTLIDEYISEGQCSYGQHCGSMCETDCVKDFNINDALDTDSTGCCIKTSPLL